MTIFALLALVFAMFLPLLIDMFAGLRSYPYRNYRHEGDVPTLDDFEVLVPIYGDIRYLENVEYLRTYGSRVILCTTSSESDEFYDALSDLSAKFGFQVYCSPLVIEQNKGRRSTSAPIRDRIIRDALEAVVKRPYVVCMDADTTSPRPLGELVGELSYRRADIASVRVVPRSSRSMFVKLQEFEYRLAMRIRFILPWLVSGACHVATTESLREVMRGHSLFFQGNDVEVGLRATRLGYTVTHIPFEVTTEAPDHFKAWWRQRVAWAGGEVRLFVTNIRFIVHHPFFWLYGLVVVIMLVAGRWYAFAHPGWGLLSVLALYYVAVCILHWRHRNGWLLLLPLYTLLYSLVIVPIGLVTYAIMALRYRNAGVISTQRVAVISES